MCCFLAMHWAVANSGCHLAAHSIAKDMGPPLGVFPITVIVLSSTFCSTTRNICHFTSEFGSRLRNTSGCRWSRRTCSSGWFGEYGDLGHWYQPWRRPLIDLGTLGRTPRRCSMGFFALWVLGDDPALVRPGAARQSFLI